MKRLGLRCLEMNPDEVSISRPSMDRIDPINLFRLLDRLDVGDVDDDRLSDRARTHSRAWLGSALIS